MPKLAEAIEKAVSDQYPEKKPNDFQMIYGKAKKKSDRVRWQEHFILQLKSHGFHIMPVNSVYNDDGKWCVFPEFRFHPTRLWRMDFAIPATKIHIEIEGGIWMGHRNNGDKGAHSRPMNIQRDIEKQNAAVMMGWRPLRFSPDEIKKGISIQLTVELNNFLSSKAD